MPRSSTIVPLALIACLAFGGAALAQTDVHVFLGKKQISDNDIEASDLDDMDELGLGVNLDFDWPVQLTIDVLVGNDDSRYSESYTYDYYGTIYQIDNRIKVELETTELQVGVRYEFLKDNKIRPYVGGGVALVKTDLKFRERFTVTESSSGDVVFDDSFSDSEDDSDVGYFLNAGVAFLVGKHLNISLDARHSDAKAKFSTSKRGTTSPEFDVGGFHYGVSLGYRW